MTSRWKLADAKAHFSEVVRKAQTDGVQRITVRGRDVAAVISVHELEALVRAQPLTPFMEFMESLRLHELQLERTSDIGRESRGLVGEG